jgi:hypothetical protein
MPGVAVWVLPFLMMRASLFTALIIPTGSVSANTTAVLINARTADKIMIQTGFMWRSNSEESCKRCFLSDIAKINC